MESNNAEARSSSNSVDAIAGPSSPNCKGAEKGGSDSPIVSNGTAGRPPPLNDDDAELDALLDDAMKDFGKMPELKPLKSQKPSGSASAPGSGDDMTQAWTEEFIKEATAQFEKKMRECLKTQDQGSGPGATPSALQAVTEDLNKVVEAATKAAVGSVSEPNAVMSQLNEAMKDMNFENPFGGNTGEVDDELAKLMSSFGMGAGGPGGEEELDEFLPFMTNFMQKLLSKDLLYPVLADVVDKYPDWLADNRAKLSNEDFDKYNRQYGFMKQICEEYAAESPSDSEETKRSRFDKISELMIKVQCCGTPPKDLIGEDGSFPGMDPAAAFAGLGMPGGPGPAGDQCSIV